MSPLLKRTVVVKNVFQAGMYSLITVGIVAAGIGNIQGFMWAIFILSPIYVVGALFSLREALTDSMFARSTATFAVFEFENAVFQWIAWWVQGATSDGISAALIGTLIFGAFSFLGWRYYFAVQQKWENT